MAGAMARPLLAALALLSIVTPAASVEVCKVVDLQLVTQTGEFFLAGEDGTRAHGLARHRGMCRAASSADTGWRGACILRVCLAVASCQQGCRWSVLQPPCAVVEQRLAGRTMCRRTQDRSKHGEKRGKIRIFSL